MEPKITHLLYVPFTGLGLYNGYRGKRWLKNRIKIFKQFVVPSLKAQTNKDFVLWLGWRFEERTNLLVKELKEYLNKEFKNVFTYSGVCFWDDKYPDKLARERLASSIHGAIGELLNSNYLTADYILMTIQPSDDCYHKDMVKEVQAIFRNNPQFEAIGFRQGYVMDYKTKELKEWNPKTIPPFFTIKFPTQTFIDPWKHLEFTGPYKSHEYVGDKLKFGNINFRGFLVGTHGENISTVFNHPFAGETADPKILEEFGLKDVEYLKVRMSLRKIIMRKLPHQWQKKLRYWLGERFYAKFYDFIRA